MVRPQLARAWRLMPKLHQDASNAAAQLFTGVQAPSACAINSSPNPMPRGTSACAESASSRGRVPAIVLHTARLRPRWAALFAREGIGLVYGGAAVGLMGTMADAARAAGGEVIGVIPQSLVEREVAHTGLDDLRV